MMNNRKVDLSIIIPIYNVKEYVLDCLESVYNGNLFNFEVICVDDCGSDNSIDIIKKYVSKNNVKNLSIIYHKKNEGLSQSRNTGLKYSKGKYICFLDSDDMIQADNLMKILNIAFKERLDIIEGNYNEIFETKMDISTNSNRKGIIEDVFTGSKYFEYMYTTNNYVPMAWCRIYKREFLLNNKLEFKKGLKFEDEEFIPRTIISAKRIKYVNIDFYVYRRRDNSITTNIIKNNNWVDSYIIIIESLNEFSKTLKIDGCYYSLLNRISEIALSIYKNAFCYGSSKENVKKIINIVKSKKIYLYPIKSNKIIIKLQGFAMKNPYVFKVMYLLMRRNKK